MASLHGPKAKMQRRFGQLLISRAKYQKIIEKRPYPPGDHGKDKQFRSGRRSAFGLQLDEKQKLGFVYNVRERQLRNYYKKAVKMPGRTGANLLILLERRLDNVVLRAGFAATIWGARQMVVHGHVNINGRRLDLPSYQVKQGDVISLRENLHKNVHVLELKDENSPVPDFMRRDWDTFSATFMRIPDQKEIQVPVDVQLNVEYYNRHT
jgi:small subunit ribosomal protein S4